MIVPDAVDSLPVVVPDSVVGLKVVSTFVDNLPVAVPDGAVGLKVVSTFVDNLPVAVRDGVVGLKVVSTFVDNLPVAVPDGVVGLKVVSTFVDNLPVVTAGRRLDNVASTAVVVFFSKVVESTVAAVAGFVVALGVVIPPDVVPSCVEPPIIVWSLVTVAELGVTRDTVDVPGRGRGVVDFSNWVERGRKEETQTR